MPNNNVVVILGGTGFMGRLLTDRLKAWTMPCPRGGDASCDDGVDVILCNRGRRYWSSGVDGATDVQGGGEESAPLPTPGAVAPAGGSDGGDGGVVRRCTWQYHTLDWDSRDVAVHLTALRRAIQRLLPPMTPDVMECGEQQEQSAVVLSFVDFSCTEPKYMQLLLRHTLRPLLSSYQPDLAATQQQPQPPHPIVRYVLVSTDSVYALPSCEGERTSCGLTRGLDEGHATVVPPATLLVLQADNEEEEERGLQAACGAGGQAEACSGTPSDSSRSSSAVSTTTTYSSSSSSSEEEEWTYGVEKRAVELLLCRYTPTTVHRCILRLPDVVGPFDRTGRFWATIMWMEVALATQAVILGPSSAPSGGFGPQHEVPTAVVGLTIPLPRRLAEVPVSFVVGDNVAGLIAWLLRTPPDRSGSCKGSAAWRTINVGCLGRAPTLRHWIAYVAQCVFAQQGHCALLDVQIALVDDVDEDAVFTPDYYPSVDCGPIATGRLAELLETEATTVPWTSWEASVATSVAFFLALLPNQGVLERRIALGKLPRTVQQEWLRLHGGCT